MFIFIFRIFAIWLYFEELTIFSMNYW